MLSHAGSGPDAALVNMRSLITRLGYPKHALFLVVGEGSFLPSGEELSTGYVVVPSGEVFAFTYGWDPDARAPALTEWERVQPEPDWLDIDEYVGARRALGLGI